MKKNKSLIIGIIITTLILVIGTSYAFFTLTLKAEKELSIVAGTFRIDYKDKNIISLENAYPMSDQKAMTSPVYEFYIENIGDIKALYDISLEEKENSNLSYTWLKYSLKRNEEEWSEPRKLTSLKLEEGFELDPNEKDTYQLRLWIDENVGNEAQGKVFVAKVVVNSVQSNAKTKDIIPPVITLNGSLSESVEQGAEYTDPGVESVVDDHDELSVSDIELSYKYFDGEKTIDVENIDTNRVGAYYIYYKIKDKSGNEGRIVRSVNVYKKNTTPPVIRLNGEKRVTVEKEHTYEELGATASKEEEDLTNRIVTIGKVNTKKAGMYEVKYLITDQVGNTASIVRIIDVVNISRISAGKVKGGELLLDKSKATIGEAISLLPNIENDYTYNGATIVCQDRIIQTLDPNTKSYKLSAFCPDLTIYPSFKKNNTIVFEVNNVIEDAFVANKFDGAAMEVNYNSTIGYYYLTSQSATSNSRGQIISKQAYDLSDYESIYARGYSFNSQKNITVFLGVTLNSNAWVHAGPRYSTYSYKEQSGQALTVDIHDVSPGKYYIAFQLVTNTQAISFEIYSATLIGKIYGYKNTGL